MKPLFLISKSLDLQILASLIASVEAYVHCKRDQRDEALPPLYMVHKGDALIFFFFRLCGWTLFTFECPVLAATSSFRLKKNQNMT